MSRWPIMRSWLVIGDAKKRRLIKTVELTKHRACCLLGAAGLGKTVELKQMAEQEREQGFDVRYERLAFLATSADRLDSHLETLASHLTDRSIIYLDALDEAMVPVRTATLSLAAWIRTKLNDHRPPIRISCRSAVWPAEVSSAIADIYGEDAISVLLQPLSDEDIREAAASKGLNGDAFLREVERTGAALLAKQPLALDMLMRIFVASGKLTSSRRKLFADGMFVLAQERIERRELGTATEIPPAEILEAAERLACFAMLSGRDAVDLGDFPTNDALGWAELSALPGGRVPLLDSLLRAIGSTGLCEGDGPRRFRFAHRQFAEYLAGRRIARLLPHQSRALLASGLGWNAGVAGPLRETAAFAAMERPEIAEWVAESDPEIIGLSDVADDALRRRGLLQVLKKFREHELTDSQISREEIQFSGFNYRGVERDLRPVLKDRSADCDDVIECAVKMIDNWQLASMSEDLADLVLDPSAPSHPRIAAGYALARFGTRSARRRLKPLIAYEGGDQSTRDLKGIALRCLWPDDLTTPELLDAMTADHKLLRFGAYEGFIMNLNHSGFSAEGYTVEGLAWAKCSVRRGSTHDPVYQIVKRIAHRAVNELEQPDVLNGLADLLLESGRTHAGSPLTPIAQSGLDEKSEEKLLSPLEENVTARRAVIDALAARAIDDAPLWWPARDTPGLLVLDDVPWLLHRAVDTNLSDAQRKNYVELTRFLPWYDHAPSIETWLQLRTNEPIASVLNTPLFIELGSDAEVKARKYHEVVSGRERLAPERKVEPPPAERVQEVLALAETKDPHYFIGLCQQLTLEEDSTHYGFARFLTKAPGWRTADAVTHNRIIEAAKRLLTANTDAPEQSQSQPLNSILMGYMQAIWLVLEFDRPWLEALPTEWWQRWAWYILRELHPNMVDEPEAPKAELVRILHERAFTSVHSTIVELATASGQESRNLLTSLLRMLDDITDGELDAEICRLITANVATSDRVGSLAEFVLARDVKRAIPACLSRLDRAAAVSAAETAVSAALALLFEKTVESWNHVLTFLRDRRDLAPRILADFAHNSRLRNRDEDEPSGLAVIGPTRAGQLVALLLELFPPERDPHYDGAHFVGPDDSARYIRDRLINRLGDQKDGESVLALKQLERQFGIKYPWLRRPRARAERSFRLAGWAPIHPATTAELLAAKTKRLIRSGADAIDGVLEALAIYERRLRHGSPSDLEDFWNLPKGKPPSPKAEERVSDKICRVIGDYFKDFAVTADREVQVYRRLLPKDAGGEPGSELDVLARIPAAGSVNEDAIAVPVEVKLSSNREARTGLKVQLVDRYMTQLGTSTGVFVVTWMLAPRLQRTHRPIWSDKAKALKELAQQARDVSAGSTVMVRPIILDLSLLTVPRKPTKTKSGVRPKTVTERTAKKSSAPGRRKQAKTASSRKATKTVTRVGKQTSAKRQPAVMPSRAKSAAVKKRRNAP